MSAPGFWQNQEKAGQLMIEKKKCGAIVEPLTEVAQLLDDAGVMLELGDEDPEGVELDLTALGTKITEIVEQLEFQLMLGGEHDIANAVVTLQSGAGGIDASDWAEMLLKMYIKWAEDSNVHWCWLTVICKCICKKVPRFTARLIKNTGKKTPRTSRT